MRQHALGGSFAITKPVFYMPLGYGTGVFPGLPIRRLLLSADSRKYCASADDFARVEWLSVALLVTSFCM
jgi:hypothetical protein